MENEIKTCPKNPHGLHHELPHPVPPDPRWWELSMKEKVDSQFCKWCGKGIW